MQIQDLDHSESIQHSILGGLEVNKVTVVVLSKSLSSARALSYFGDATAIAIAKNNLGISLN